MTESVYIKGLPELTRKLNRLQDLRQIVPELKEGATHLRGTIKKYPPATIANSPSNPTRRWYQRLYGSKYRRLDGTVKGYPTSERLRDNWGIANKNRGLTWIVSTEVSYSEYVQGSKQTGFHKRTGWKTIFDVSESESNVVLDLIKRKVDRILAS